MWAGRFPLRPAGVVRLSMKFDSKLPNAELARTYFAERLSSLQGMQPILVRLPEGHPDSGEQPTPTGCIW
jgi:hypothetical protein